MLDRIPNKREFLARSLGALGVFRLLERISTRRWPALVVLTYHRIGSPGIKSNPYYDPVISATPEAFRDQLRFLRERFSMVRLEEIAGLDQASLGSRAKPAALVTFDDGYRDNFETALPILRGARCAGGLFHPDGFLASAEAAVVGPRGLRDQADAISKIDAAPRAWGHGPAHHRAGA